MVVILFVYFLFFDFCLRKIIFIYWKYWYIYFFYVSYSLDAGVFFFNVKFRNIIRKKIERLSCCRDLGEGRMEVFIICVGKYNRINIILVSGFKIWKINFNSNVC